MSKEQLAARQVELLDIASTATDYWSYVVGTNTTDFSKFNSETSGRGPLLEGWQVCMIFASYWSNYGQIFVNTISVTRISRDIAINDRDREQLGEFYLFCQLLVMNSLYK